MVVLNGLLTIVWQCYRQQCIPFKITIKDKYVPNLIDKFLIIETNFQKSEEITDSIYEQICYDTYYNAYNAFLSNNPNKAINILKYLLLGLLVGSKVNTMLSVDYVLQVMQLKRQVLLEAHRMKGLVRFISIGNNIFYSTVHLDNNVIEQIGKHFIHRLPTQNFIIIDKNRNIAFLYNTKKYFITDIDNLNLPNLDTEEEIYQTLWKKFYETISISERKNLRLQSAYMPKRYWKDLVEMQ